MERKQRIRPEQKPEKEGTQNRLEGGAHKLDPGAGIRRRHCLRADTFVIANSEVPTGSMENTIMAHSRVIGSRLHYKFADPERGDVAIFVFGWQCPRCTAIGEGEDPGGLPRPAAMNWGNGPRPFIM